MNLRSEKETLRASIKERLKRLSSEDRVRESRSLCKRLLQELPAEAGVLCVFYPMTGSEADIRSVFPTLFERGWKLFFPRFEGNGFAFRRASSLDALVPGKYGLMEPMNDDPPLDPADVDIALIPGLAFDSSGGRIGRGNGGYDRWLQELRIKNHTAKVWGIALDCQIVTLVPKESHDHIMDGIVTPRGFIDPAAPGTGLPVR